METLELAAIEKLDSIPVRSSNYGGKRPGSGRKANLEKLNVKGRKEIFWEELTAERFREVIVAFISRAKRTDKPAQWLMEQVIGRAAQRIELTGKDGEALAFTWIAHE